MGGKVEEEWKVLDLSKWKNRAAKTDSEDCGRNTLEEGGDGNLAEHEVLLGVQVKRHVE